MWRRVRYVLALLALCAIATCPAAKRACNAKIRAREAEQLLGVIADKVEQHVAVTGRVPGTAAPLTPQLACCEQGGQCQPDPATWAAPGWKELEFSIDDPYRYAYEYAPDPSGQSRHRARDRQPRLRQRAVDVRAPADRQRHQARAVVDAPGSVTRVSNVVRDRDA